MLGLIQNLFVWIHLCQKYLPPFCARLYQAHCICLCIWLKHTHSIRPRLQQGAVKMRRSSGGGYDDDDEDDGGGGGDLEEGQQASHLWPHLRHQSSSSLPRIELHRFPCLRLQRDLSTNKRVDILIPDVCQNMPLIICTSSTEWPF